MIELKYIPTEHMVADVLIKALVKDQRGRLVVAFGIEKFGYLQNESVEVG